MKGIYLALLFIGYGYGQRYNPFVGRRPRYDYIRTVGTGSITGKLSTATKGRNFVSYYGIPYAKPPVKELRLKDPVYLESWTGMRNGSVAPPVCSQITLKTSPEGETGYIGQEDCLYLNIFTPEAVVINRQLPVMVFFHGGSFYSGSSHPYEGGEFLNKDVILVVVQYRLGVLGFLNDGGEAIPGNFGLKDQATALQWVQDNIRFFGGDRSRVTIFGSGAGAASVHFLILSDKTKGLFSRAIMQSGNALCPWARSQETKQNFQHLLGHMGCEEKMGNSTTSNAISRSSSEETLRCLQKVDAKKITKIIEKFFVMPGNPLVFGPYHDGDFLGANPEFLLKEGLFRNLDIMVGTTKDDGAFLVNGLSERKNFFEEITNHFSIVAPITLGLPKTEVEPVETSASIYNHYMKSMLFSSIVHANNINRFEKMLTDNHFGVCTDRTAILHALNSRKSTNKVFAYEFAYYGSRATSKSFKRFKNMRWVSHGDELFYLFPMTSHPTRELSLDKYVKSDMVKLWVNFATNGNPTPNDYWKPFTLTNHQKMVIDLYSGMRKDTSYKTRRFWNSLRTRQNIFLYPEKVINGFQIRQAPPKETEMSADDKKMTEKSLHESGLIATKKWPHSFL